jgi:sodium/bile acid cotransporter 7
LALRRISIDPFIATMLAAIAAATFWPAAGIGQARLEATSSIAVGLLFFLHGAALSPREIRHGAGQWRLHLFIMIVTFGIFPVLTYVIGLGLSGRLPPELLLGFIYLGALPSAVSSSIAFTSMARGNVPAAVCSAGASNVFGLLLTPLLVSALHANGAEAFDLVDAAGKVVVDLLAPFGAGQVCRRFAARFIERHNHRIEKYDQGVVVLVIYVAFSRSVVEGIWSRLPPTLLILAVGLCLTLLAMVLLITTTGAKLLGLSRADQIAAVFCGSKKSLASGLPLAQVLFSGTPDFGLIILPIMIYNQIQILVGAALARRYAIGADAVDSLSGCSPKEGAALVQTQTNI